MDIKMRLFGFSLAEILVTLTIIGVVAAMTIPNLVQQYQKDQTVTQLKSTFTIINNALEASKTENGTDVNTWYIPNDTLANASTYFAENYILPNLKTINVCGTSTQSKCNHKVGYLSNMTSETKGYYAISGDSTVYSFTIPNGAILGISAHTLNGNTLKDVRTQISIDINGTQKPNIMGKDAYLIELGGEYGAGNRNKLFLPYAYKPGYNDNTYQNNGTIGCRKDLSGATCFALIMNNNWKITDVYPW